MVDLSQTVAAKSEQLNADDLTGKSLTVKITKVSRTDITDQPISINFEGDNNKPFLPCKSMRRVLIHVWGKDGASYVGKSMTLYRDDKVKFGGLEVGGIRISHMSHIDKDIHLALTATKANKKAFTVKPLVVVKRESEIALQEPSQIQKDGLAAANKGIQAYKDWLSSITAEQKETIKSSHSEWSKIAKSVGQ